MKRIEKQTALPQLAHITQTCSDSYLLGFSKSWFQAEIEGYKQSHSQQSPSIGPSYKSNFVEEDFMMIYNGSK